MLTKNWVCERSFNGWYILRVYEGAEFNTMIVTRMDWATLEETTQAVYEGSKQFIARKFSDY